MPDEVPVDVLISSAESALDDAARLLFAGDANVAAEHLDHAVTDLLIAGSRILGDVFATDGAGVTTGAARTLRALAEQLGILPEDHQPILTLVPKASALIAPKIQAAAETHLPIVELPKLLKEVYRGETPVGELSDEEAHGYVSAGNILIDLLQGQRTFTDAVFSDFGPYDTFASVAAPYLITGAAYLGGEDDTSSCEETIPRLLSGPVKRLLRLFIALMTSAFMAGLLLLLIRRLLAVRNIRPGSVDNVIFAGSVAALVLANLPMFITGLRAVVGELRELQAIISASDAE